MSLVLNYGKQKVTPKKKKENRPKIKTIEFKWRNNILQFTYFYIFPNNKVKQTWNKSYIRRVYKNTEFIITHRT